MAIWAEMSAHISTIWAEYGRNLGVKLKHDTLSSIAQAHSAIFPTTFMDSTYFLPILP